MARLYSQNELGLIGRSITRIERKARRTLGLILAAGKGTRVQSVLEADEPVKAMIKIDGERLIHKSIRFLDGAVDEIAVLSSPSEEYASLDRVVNDTHNVKLLKQKAKPRDMPMILELPYILFFQYHLSSDRGYLRSFDSILTMPSDLVFSGVHITEMLEMHNKYLKSPGSHQLTVMSKNGTGPERADFFGMQGDRILSMQKYKPELCCETNLPPTYAIGRQPATFLFSKGLLQRPFTAMLGPGFFVHVYRYVTNGTWTNYGNPENIIAMRKNR